ncbi:MAG: alkene reductase, partial [Alcaligenaceae bacterium]
IITEGSQVSPQGKGYPYTPGIYSAPQIEGWQKVTKAVHMAGGKIFLQLWHVGRISLPSVQPDGALPVAPSAIAAVGKLFTPDGMRDFVAPRALEESEIAGVVEQFRQAAENAHLAGFDGVEVHAANGYLIDQFLRDGTNKRTDSYGDSVENRMKFLFEVVDAVSTVWGAGKVGVRISPINQFNTIQDSNPQELFNQVARALAARNIAYLHVIEQDGTGKTPAESFDWMALRSAFAGVYMANGSYDKERATKALATGAADLIAFGKLFLTNPDLPRRFAEDAPFNKPWPEKFYSGGPEGYTDYPELSAAPVAA